MRYSRYSRIEPVRPPERTPPDETTVSEDLGSVFYLFFSSRGMPVIPARSLRNLVDAVQAEDAWFRWMLRRKPE